MLDKNNFKIIVINKNRGWRGLAKVDIKTEHNSYPILQMTFSFSSKVWEDMLNAHIVIQDKDYYYVIEFDNTPSLPKPTQQRSVLIKDFIANILNVNRYNKSSWATNTNYDDWCRIKHFIDNKNNHTQSNWNCIGMRVYPTI